ncbi:peptidoglycan DD-metalloendopeptidase family protein [Sinomonas susongensis]|uniref:peptidoglycan DD-metalloendopeptidase family protein n=1 Tax=Sinomonas susongensis TaxID=1324851 RepID=UPI001108D378|nr:peptidoglycan DD-metalloendopeptidase family protein [Sinomonas susongensis]
MPVVGVAEILVRPSFDGAQKAISKELTGSADAAGESAGKSAGSKMGAALSKTLKAGAVAAGAAITGVLGTAIVKGFGRMSAIEQAQAKLIGLGNSAGDVKAIMDNALASVKGTAFGLDEAATVAASAVASGIKPGAQLEGVLKTVADTATIAGASMSDMGLIFGSVAARGKLQGDDLMQLQARGVPVLQFLAKHYGITAQAASDMVSKGKVDFENFNAAMKENLGGAALASGNTTVGAFKNMGAALSRFGAALLKDVFPLIGPVFNKITSGLDAATAKVGPFVDKMVTGLRRDVGGALDAFLGGWQNADAQIQSSGMVAFLERTGQIARDAFNGIGPLISGIGEAIGPILPGLASMWDALSPIHLAFEALAPVLPTIVGALAGLGSVVAGALASSLPEVAFAMNSLVAAVSGVLIAVLPSVVQLISGLADALTTAAPVAADLVAALAPLVADVLDKMAPVLADLTATLLPAAVTLLDTTLKIVGPLIDGIASAINNIPGGADTVTTALAAIVGAYTAYQAALAVAATKAWALAAAQSFLTGSGFLSTLVQGTLWFIGLARAQGIAAAAQWALNMAMNNNPVGKIIMLISALVAGLVWFFTQTELGKQIVANVWQFIQDSIRAVGDWFTGTLVPAFQAAVKWVGDAFTWLYESVIKPVWDAIGAAIDWAYNSVIKPMFEGVGTGVNEVGGFFTWLQTAVIEPVFNGIAAVFDWWWNNITSPILNAVIAAVQAVGGWFSWLYNDILDPVFQLIGAAIAWWWNNLAMPTFNAVVGFIRDTLAAVFTWFHDSVVKPVFDAVGAAISWVSDNVIKPVVDAWNIWFGVVLPAMFTWFQTNVIKPVFDAIGNAIKWVSDNVINPVVTAWNMWFGTILPGIFNWLYANVVKPVFDAIGNAINWVWQNVILPVFQAVQNTINAVGAVFNWLYVNAIKPAFDGIGAAIDWVWKNVIKPVFDTISDVVQHRIPDAFEQGKKLIGDIWKGIQDLVKAPIKFVVQTVLNDGLIHAFNDVAGFLGTKKLGLIDLPPGFAGGGYTGDGDKYQPAGIVHAGEFVFTKAQTAKAGVSNLYALASALNGYAAGGLVSPLDHWALAQGYKGDAHNGLDMAAPEGTPIHAAGPGRVSFAGWGANNMGGNEMHIDHPNGLQTWYAHQSRFAAHVGDMVRAGQTVGYVGQTGMATGPHLHYMVLHGGWPNYTDPTPYLTGGGEAGGGSGGGFNPVAAIIDGLMGQFKSAFPQGGFVVDLIGGVAKNIVQGVSDFIEGIFGGKKPDNSTGSAEGIPHLFRDKGGALPEGLSMVLNRTGSPEWVFNRQQLAALDGAVTGGGQTVNNFNGLFGFDPDELLDRQETRRRDALAMEGIYA